MNGQGAAIRFTVRAQRGAALVVSAIMLVLITLFALAVINMSTANLRVANNEQIKAQSVASAQQAIEQVASTNFPANPQPTTVAVDINHDGSTDYNVAVAKPVCNNSVPIKLVELDITQSSDVACFASAASSGSGAIGSAGSGNSVCSNTQWDVSATATDAINSGATVTVHQGVGQRVPIGTTC
jgi:archaellum component FlaF (FlaF/FlaG flagellin family)